MIDIPCPPRLPKRGVLARADHGDDIEWPPAGQPTIKIHDKTKEKNCTKLRSSEFDNQFRARIEPPSKTQ